MRGGLARFDSSGSALRRRQERGIYTLLLSSPTVTLPKVSRARQPRHGGCRARYLFGRPRGLGWRGASRKIDFRGGMVPGMAKKIAKKSKKRAVLPKRKLCVDDGFKNIFEAGSVYVSADDFEDRRWEEKSLELLDDVRRRHYEDALDAVLKHSRVSNEDLLEIRFQLGLG